MNGSVILKIAGMIFVSFLFYVGAKYENRWAILAAILFLFFGKL